MDGRSNRAVFNMCTSNNNCSAPTAFNGLHLNNCCTNFAIKELKQILNIKNFKSFFYVQIRVMFLPGKFEAKLREIFSTRR